MTHAPCSSGVRTILRCVQVSTYSASTNGTAAKTPAPAATPDLRKDGNRDALARSGRRLAQAAPSEQVTVHRLSQRQSGIHVAVQGCLCCILG